MVAAPLLVGSSISLLTVSSTLLLGAGCITLGCLLVSTSAALLRRRRQQEEVEDGLHFLSWAQNVVSRVNAAAIDAVDAERTKQKKPALLEMENLAHILEALDASVFPPTVICVALCEAWILSSASSGCWEGLEDGKREDCSAMQDRDSVPYIEMAVPFNHRIMTESLSNVLVNQISIFEEIFSFVCSAGSVTTLISSRCRANSMYGLDLSAD
ncbi:hypothetical protein COCNU_08G003280 [Cocos nucifera]|uniref:Uncharacterized protein n=1 Tax=Cocos nucifera TaxID=13894 RepID=A0A8K0IHS3_COCNU|nr:hypothetical protein COCNU_08G003280 [Cocos nucifera]